MGARSPDDRLNRPVDPSLLLLSLDLAGTFAFALGGALAAIRAARLDVFGVLTLGMVTALGGGIVRDILIGALPPATFSDWRYLLTAALGSLVAFLFAWRLEADSWPVITFDAMGLSLFAVTGATKALTFGVGPAQAILLGVITAVGGGTLRDALLGRVAVVLTSGLYAIPAMLAATVVVAADRFGVYGLPAALWAAAVCFAIRMVGVRLGLNAPRPPRGWADQPERAEPVDPA